MTGPTTEVEKGYLSNLVTEVKNFSMHDGCHKHRMQASLWDVILAKCDPHSASE